MTVFDHEFKLYKDLSPEYLSSVRYSLPIDHEIVKGVSSADDIDFNLGVSGWSHANTAEEGWELIRYFTKRADNIRFRTMDDLALRELTPEGVLKDDLVIILGVEERHKPYVEKLQILINCRSVRGRKLTVTVGADITGLKDKASSAMRCINHPKGFLDAFWAAFKEHCKKYDEEQTQKGNKVVKEKSNTKRNSK